MPFLLYCICEARAEVAAAAAGVRAAAVEEIVAGGLRCFYSEVELDGDAAAMQRDAVDFHRVTHSIFQRAAIIPFRFPTLVKDRAEATGFMSSHAGEYEQALKRLRGAAQMEVRISAAGPAVDAASGAEYLRDRAEVSRKLEQAAASCRSAAQASALEWRQRPSRDGVRCFALVPRGEVYNFEEALRGLRLDGRLDVIVSGPWPATEFLDFHKADSSGAKAPSE